MDLLSPEIAGLETSSNSIIKEGLAQHQGFPLIFESSSFAYSSPIIHDVNGDGIPDAILCDVDGGIYIIGLQQGREGKRWFFKGQVPRIFLRRNWVESRVNETYRALYPEEAANETEEEGSNKDPYHSYFEYSSSTYGKQDVLRGVTANVLGQKRHHVDALKQRRSKKSWIPFLGGRGSSTSKEEEEEGQSESDDEEAAPSKKNDKQPPKEGEEETTQQSRRRLLEVEERHEVDASTFPRRRLMEVYEEENEIAGGNSFAHRRLQEGEPKQEEPKVATTAEQAQKQLEEQLEKEKQQQQQKEEQERKEREAREQQAREEKEEQELQQHQQQREEQARKEKEEQERQEQQQEQQQQAEAAKEQPKQEQPKEEPPNQEQEQPPKKEQPKEEPPKKDESAQEKNKAKSKKDEGEAGSEESAHLNSRKDQQYSRSESGDDDEAGPSGDEGPHGDDMYMGDDRYPDYGGGDDMYEYDHGGYDDYYGRYRSYRDDFYDEKHYVRINPHILATPALAEIPKIYGNEDEVEDILFVPVSYYFDEDEYEGHLSYRRFENTDAGDETEVQRGMYLASAIMLFQLGGDPRWGRQEHLDLSTDYSAPQNLTLLNKIPVSPDNTKMGAFAISTPAIADIDGDGKMEVLIGTSMGIVYAFDATHMTVKSNWPIQMQNAVESPIVVEDVAGNTNLEVFVQDVGGNVAGFDENGNKFWHRDLRAAVSDGNSAVRASSPMTLGDVDGDGIIDVVVSIQILHGQDHGEATYLFALNAATGKDLPNFPIQFETQGTFKSKPGDDWIHEQLPGQLLVDLHQDQSHISDYIRRNGTRWEKRNRSKGSFGGSAPGLHIIMPIGEFVLF